MAALTPAQRAALEESGARGVRLNGRIQPREPGTRVPLTRAQELLWLLDRTTPGLTAYNVPAVYRFQGRLDPAALRRALDWLVGRHEILRTAFLESTTGPVQEVRPPSSVPVAVVDLRAVPEGDREAAAALAVRSATERVLPLDAGLLLQATVITVAPSDQILVLLTHHIASDAWSLRILERELAHAYESVLAGSEPNLAEPSLQFGDYAVFAHGRLTNGRGDELLAYWREQLADAPRQLDLPVDRPRPALPRFEGARRSRAFNPELDRALAETSAVLGVSRFMILLAAFEALLARWTDQDDILVATPMAERERTELAGVVGYLVNTLPIRARIGPATTFSQLVLQVRQALLGADEHRDLPFETIAVAVGAATGAPALQLQTAFAVTVGEGASPFQLAGLTRTPMPFSATWAKFEVSLTVQDHAGALRGLLEYRADLFDPATADRLLTCYETLLEGALRAPDQPVRGVDLVTEAERRQLIDEWNDTDAPLPPDADVAGLIRARALASPDAVAVSFGDRGLTYRELDDRAGRLARHLQGRGVGPEVRVGVCLDPSLELPVALLGILQAGGTVVPLDPMYPMDRLAFMIGEADLRAIITSGALAPELPVSAVPRILLEAEWESIAAGAVRPDPVPSDPDRAAYLLFTSGSTGRPKGVLLLHRGLVNHHLAAIELYGLSPADRVPQLASLNFDISVEEMFPVWVAGGTVILRPVDLPMVGRAFNEWLDSAQATVLSMPTAHWQEWTAEMAAAGDRVPRGIRLVGVGGEAPSGKAYAEWCRISNPTVRWINTYGPTETTCFVTSWEPSRTADEPVTEFPIGRPYRNVRAYVLDGDGRPVPVGFPGELCIGGAGVARGYLNQPAQTAEKFVPDRFRPGDGHRIYRTGDRARYRRDGNLVFLGRFDDQVKLSGFRIELGEIESALRASAGVVEAVALVREDRPGQRLLVGYYTPSMGHSPDPAALRVALQERLPAYMIPAQLVAVASFPLTPNGKLDRKALPAPEALDPTHHAAVAPATRLEREITALWSEILDTDAFGVEDDFFALGGHSLQAMRIASRLRQEYGVPVTLADILSHSTVRRLATFVGAEPTPRPAGPAASLRSIAGRRAPGGGAANP
jgi:amino acid adenylation domain-containing protein